MEQEPVTLPVVLEGEAPAKSPLSSKTIHFNWVSALLIRAMMPFLPKWLQESPYIFDAAIAWFSIGNIILRFATKEAVSFFWKRQALVSAFVQRAIFWRLRQDAKESAKK